MFVRSRSVRLGRQPRFESSTIRFLDKFSLVRLDSDSRFSILVISV